MSLRSNEHDPLVIVMSSIDMSPRKPVPRLAENVN